MKQCEIIGCQKQSKGRWCSMHEARWRRHGHFERLRTGIKHHHAGYILRRAPKHPFARDGYIYEHRLIMEQYLGRYLLSNEVVHHKNGCKSDNRLDNLEVLTHQQHRYAHMFHGKAYPTKHECIALLLQCAKAIGRTPTRRAWMTWRKGEPMSGIRYIETMFGGWSQFILDSQLPLHSYQRSAIFR